MALNVSILSPLDTGRGGKMVNQQPAWFHDALVENLEDEIHDIEVNLQMRKVPETSIHKVETELRQKKERLKDIMDSKPKLVGGQKDAVAKIYKDIGEKIRDTMFSYSDMQRGLANPREEIRRRTAQIIPIGEHAKHIGEQLGVKINKGKVSGNDAARIFQVCGKMLGENTNTEALRKDFNHGVFRAERSIDDISR